MSKITKELIDKAKKEHGEVYVLEAAGLEGKTLGDLDLSEEKNIDKIETATGAFQAEKGKYYAILKKPSKQVIGMSMTSKDPIQMGNTILRNSIVIIDGEEYCDDEIHHVDDINIAAALEVTTFINIGTAKLKKY